MSDYAHWQAYLAKGRDKLQRKVDNNTYVVARENAIAIRLHGTDVVTITPDNHYILNSGGWQTVTTKDRINKYAHPIYLSQEKGVWHIAKRGQEWKDRTWIPFADGMEVDAEGNILSGADEGKLREVLAGKLDKLLRNYVKGFVAEIAENGINDPDSGDCFYCHMVTVEGQKPLGDAVGDVSHLFMHFEEGYYVPSLLASAVKERYMHPQGQALAWQFWIQEKREARVIRDCLNFYFRKRKQALLDEMQQRE